MMMMLMMMIRDYRWSGYSVTVIVQCLKIIYSSENKVFVYV